MRLHAVSRFWRWPAEMNAPRPIALARYYALVTASIALGTIDRLRAGPPAAWEKSEGTR